MRVLLVLVLLAGLAVAEPEPLLRLGSEKFRHAGFHAGAETRLALSADGSHLVTGSSYSGSIRVWEAASGKLVRQVDLEPPGVLRGFALSDDSVWLATLEQVESEDRLRPAHWVRLRDAKSGRLVRSLPCPAASIRQRLGSRPIQFVPGQAEVVALTSEGLVIWDAPTGLELGKQPIPDLDRGEFRVSANRRFVVTSANQVGYLFWDLPANKGPQAVSADVRQIEQFALSPDGKTLAATSFAGFAGPVTLLDAETGRRLRVLAGPGLPGVQTTFAFTPDGRRLLATDDGDRNRRLPWREGGLLHWDVATGELLDRWGVPGEVNALALSFSGTRVALDAPGLPTWDLKTGQRVNPDTASDRIPIQQVIPHGDFLLLLSDSVWPQLRDGRTGKLLHELPHDQGYVRSGAFSRDGKLVATGAYDGIRIWDTATGRLVERLPGHLRLGTTAIVEFAGPTLVSTGSDLWLRTFDPRVGKETGRTRLKVDGIEPPDEMMRDSLHDFRLAMLRPEFSPDGSRLLLDATIFDTQTGRGISHLGKPAVPIGRPEAFTHDARQLLRGEHEVVDQEHRDWVRCYDVGTGEPLWSQPVTSRAHHLLAVSPDEATFAWSNELSKAGQHAVEFRSLADGRVVGQLAGLPSAPTHLAYLPQRRGIAVTFRDGTAAIYSVARPVP